MYVCVCVLFRVRQSVSNLLVKISSLIQTSHAGAGHDGSAAHNNSTESDDECLVTKCEQALILSSGTSTAHWPPVITSEYVDGKGWLRGELLGSGGYARVYRAVDLTTGHFMAVKQLPTGGGPQAQQAPVLKSLQRELALMELQPRHAHVVAYFGSVQEDDVTNLFMELVVGSCLSEYLTTHGPPAPSTLRCFAKQILAALVYLHGLGVIHRDVKCANVLMEAATNRLKLCDYGVSILRNSSCAAASAMSSQGTPAFIAPEVIRGEPSGRRADVWSFGCTMIEMGNGHAPWAELALGPFQLMYYIAENRGMPQIPAGLGDAGVALVHACMQRQYDLRPTAEQLLAHPYFSADLTDDIAPCAVALSDGCAETGCSVVSGVVGVGVGSCSGEKNSGDASGSGASGSGSGASGSGNEENMLKVKVEHCVGECC